MPLQKEFMLVVLDVYIRDNVLIECKIYNFTD
jgi:hypothetical protein